MSVGHVCRRVGVLGRLSTDPEDQFTPAARRALAYLAVKGPVVQRSLMSMDLWPSVLDARARANLRRAIWQAPDGWISASSWEVRLQAEADLDAARRAADRAFGDLPLDVAEVDLLTRDLLPGWYDDWLVDEQEAFHLMRVQALEAVCRDATRLRQFGLATRAGLAAVIAEPLRQSAVCALIQAHLDEGNAYEALRRYEHYRSLLNEELGVDPDPAVSRLVQDVAGGSARAGSWPARGLPPARHLRT